MNLFRKKDIAHLAQDAEKSGFVRNLTAFDLVFLGIGSVTGIFVLTGVGAALYAGPGIAISFILASVACAFAVVWLTRNIPQWYQYLEVHMLIHTLH